MCVNPLGVLYNVIPKMQMQQPNVHQTTKSVVTKNLNRKNELRHQKYAIKKRQEKQIIYQSIKKNNKKNPEKIRTSTV